MKKILYIIPVLVIFVASCQKDFLDQQLNTNYEDDQVFTSYSRIRDFGIGMYDYVPSGFNRIDGAMLAAASDEAEHTYTGSAVQKFNIGSWNPYVNPDDCWAYNYAGIRKTTKFIEKTGNFKSIIYRDTLTATGKQEYETQVEDIQWLRNEARFLRSLCYFELIKRYGGVPLITKTLTLEDDLSLPRNSFDEVVSFIVTELDNIKDSLPVTWVDSKTGRATKGAVLALKSRVLLYAASPLFSADNQAKWEKAAEAANDVIKMGKYSLHNDYRQLFLPPNTYKSDEVIFVKRGGASNSFEKANYPIGYEGGQSGTTPTQNLVDAYEKLSGWTAANPYQNVDPRMQASIIVNNSTWKGRAVEIWAGGQDGYGKERATGTGYYLKKYVDESLDLLENKTSIHAWILFRYAETLLNYAEAMNEAFGPDSDPEGYGLTAVAALNLVRSRPGVNLPALDASAFDENSFRLQIRKERQVELAFEEHRFWDVRRWKIADETIGQPINGMYITKNTDGTFNYQTRKVEDRFFSENMYLYPIPQAEILKSDNKMSQNPDW